MPAYDTTKRPGDTGPGFHGDGGRFRRTLFQVMTVQVISLLLLWLLQWRYNR